jgi:hypothetical protein
MLLYSPRWLFLIPGSLMAVLGLALLLALATGPITIGKAELGVHSMVLGLILAVTGTQIALMGLFARVYAHITGIDEDPAIEGVLGWLTLERGLLISASVFAVGFGVNTWVLARWIATDFQFLDAISAALVGGTLMVLGVQGIFGTFFLSVLRIERR